MAERGWQRGWVGLMVVGMASAAWGAGDPAAGDAAAWERDAKNWRNERLARLQSPNGWLSLAGLTWLTPGVLTVGSGAQVSVRLPASAPTLVGVLAVTPEGVTLNPVAGVGLASNDKPLPAGPVAMASDAQGSPTIIQVGSVSFYAIQRGDRLGIRIKDRNAETLKAFTSIETWPFAPSWRVTARWEPFASPQKLKVPNVLGTTEAMDSPGVAVFTVNGTEHRIQPVLEDGEKELFFIFADTTNKSESYGAGRFLYADPPNDGMVVLDFNRAYNPPCAFTPYATCPIPPPQNRLALRVEAGEKRYGKGRH